MPVKSLFATPFYQDVAADADLLAELEHSCRVFEKEDKAGRLWSKQNAYPGYTSYSSLNDLPLPAARAGTGGVAVMVTVAPALSARPSLTTRLTT